MSNTIAAWSRYYCRRWQDLDKVATEPNPIVAHSLACKSGGRVLDIGAGAGRDALHLARSGFIVHAIDLTTSGVLRMNAIATKEHLSLTARVADASVYFPSECYDVIVCILVLNHLSDLGARTLIKKMQMHTASEGINVVVTLTQDGDSYALKTERDYFYPVSGELHKLYAQWSVLDYQERRVAAEAGWWRACAVENIQAEIIAQKPRS